MDRPSPQTAVPASDGSGSHGSGRRRRAFQATFDPDDVVAGRYRIIRFIAQGGMGEVYEAEDIELSERVALKTVKPEIAEEPGALDRFKREIQLSRRVTHPNVCRIFDLGRHRIEEPGGEPWDVVFLTMELLHGQTLSARIKAGRMSVQESLPIVQQMAAALATAHDAGIIHRDFKSSNVVLVSSKKGERAVVADFGLAHGAAGSSGASLTATGKVIGTPAYIAPEQLEGKPVGPEADLYALGVVMFEMVTGRWPFVADSPFATATKRLNEKPPSPRTFAPDLDSVWESTILRCLERQPEDRFHSSADVVRALGGEAVAVGRRTRRNYVLGATAAAALILAVMVAFGVRRSPQGAADTPTASPVARTRRAVAVLGFKNLGRPDSAWLSQALIEMMRTEIGAGGQVRTIPGQSVSRMKLELDLPDADSLAKDTLARVRANLGADLVVLGSYLAAGKEGRLRLDLSLQDTTSGEVVATASEMGTEDGIFDLVSTSGARLREALGIGRVESKEAGSVRAALPAGSEAQQLYAIGLEKLRVFDAKAARDLLLKAVAADPSHALSHSALATAWAALGFDQNARVEAQKAFDLAKDLSREDRLAVEARLRETSGEWDKAAEIYRGLLVFYPDNLEYGLRLAEAQTAGGKGEAALATVNDLRKRPAPTSEDPRIDLAEAAAAKALTDFDRQLKAATGAAERAQKQGARLLLAQARLAQATALVNLGKLAEAQAAAAEASRSFAAAGDRAGVARCENILAVVSARMGDVAGAKRRFEASLQASREIGDQKMIAKQLNNIGNTEMSLGNKPAARKLFQEAASVAREIGDKSDTALALNNLGAALWEMGDAEGARRTYEEALAIYRDLGETRHVAALLFNLAEALEKQGKLKPALAHYEEATKLNRQLGDDQEAADSLTRLGALRSATGDAAGARRDLEEALALADKAGDPAAQAAAMRAMADLAERQGDAQQAASLRAEAAAKEKTASSEN